MNTRSILFLLLLMNSLYSQGQQHLSIELGGIGGLGSINWETPLHQQENFTLTFRTGFSFIPIDRNNGSALVFPQLIHGIYGKELHFVDLGIGLAPSITTTLGGAYVRMPASIGYRLQPKDKPYYFRIAYTPLVSFLLDLQWEHWAGITYGIRL
ncbi:MAG: hypothetical protein AAFQ83_23235 [Bacteroidota bacterium]